jgi:DNA-binding SARP family transcriptional activator
VKAGANGGKDRVIIAGHVAIIQNGEGVSGQISAKSRALLCYLAVTGHSHTWEKLAGLFWGEKTEESAKAASLRKPLSNLRQLFGDGLIISHQTVAFNRDRAYWLDVKALGPKMVDQRLW